MEDEQTLGFSILAIVVGFEDHTEFVFNSDPDPLARLNSFVQDGGQPVGLAGFRKLIGNRRGLLTRPFKEYKDEEWVKRYMAALSDSIVATMAAFGIGESQHNPEHN